MNERAGIVIIGGGIIGTAVAYHLAKRGVAKDVLVLEQATVGSGTTSASGGGIRSQFSTEPTRPSGKSSMMASATSP